MKFKIAMNLHCIWNTRKLFQHHFIWVMTAVIQNGIYILYRHLTVSVPEFYKGERKKKKKEKKMKEKSRTEGKKSKNVPSQI